MKYFWFFVAVMLLGTVNLVFATQETPTPNTKSDFPESIRVGEKVPFSLKLSNLEYYRVSDIEPIITIMPKSASSFVQVEINPQISTLWDGFYYITHGTILVDKDIPVDRIFVSVSFMGKNQYGEQVSLSETSTFNASIKIEKSQNDYIVNSTKIDGQNKEKQDTNYVKYELSKNERFALPIFIKKRPLPSEITQSMLDWCADSSNSARNDPRFWDSIPIRILSTVSEFQSLKGKTESFVVNSHAAEEACPPNVWMTGTFMSKNGEKHKFSLFHDGDFFRYNIDEIQCKKELVVAIKVNDNIPTCVKQETLQKLRERGWAVNKEERAFPDLKQKILPKFEIIGLNYAVHPDEPLMISVTKTGYDMCDSWDARIIDASDDSIIWERDYSTSCIVLDPPKQQKFDYKISSENKPIVVPKVGTYVFQITIGEAYLEQEFIVRNNFSGGSLDRTIYPTITISSPDNDPNPYSIILQIGVNNTTYWKNESNMPITLTSEDQRWSTGLISPNEGKIIQFNETAFYKYRGLPSTAINGRIAILSDQTEFLPIQEKLAIAREIIKVDMGNPITAIGIGNADNVLDITIHEDELEKNPNAEEYYKKRYQDMIPFEVPIRIEFGHIEPV